MEEKPPLTPGGKADNILVYSKSARNGKSSSSSKEQRGRATGCKHACGGDCEVHPGARGVMAPGAAAVIGLSGC